MNESKPKRAKGKVDKSKALKLRLDNHLTYQQIADTQGVSKQAIHTAHQHLIPDKDKLEPFKNHRADILANVQMKQIESYLSMTDLEQKEAIKRRGLVDMGIAYDKERIERGQNPEGIQITINTIQQIKAMQDKQTTQAIDIESDSPA